MTTYPKQQIRRSDREVTDPTQAFAIIDEALVLHLAFNDNGLPYALPMAFVRVDNAIYVHGSPVTRLLQQLAQGIQISASFVLLDGLVLAKTAFLHSMNYRAVVVFGKAQLVHDEEEKHRAFDALTEKIAPGRSALLRRSDDFEIRATSLIKIEIEQLTCKVKNSPPREPATGDDVDGFVGIVPVRQEIDWQNAVSTR